MIHKRIDFILFIYTLVTTFFIQNIIANFEWLVVYFIVSIVLLIIKFFPAKNIK